MVVTGAGHADGQPNTTTPPSRGASASTFTAVLCYNKFRRGRSIVVSGRTGLLFDGGVVPSGPMAVDVTGPGQATSAAGIVY